MKKILMLLYFFALVCPLTAQETMYNDISVLLENKIWKMRLPDRKKYRCEMEFRKALWATTLMYDGSQENAIISYSYALCGDTIKVFESGENYRIVALTDSTLVIQHLPEGLSIGSGLSEYVTDSSPSGQRENENRLVSLWRKEVIWNLGVAKITGEPVKDLSTIEPPKWAKWNYDLERYFISRMKYPQNLLEKNHAGYSVAMFEIDTLGMSRFVTILASTCKDFDREVTRLVKELPHCLPCRDKEGKRMKCFYTVYVPFLPQHYRDRMRTDSIAEEELKHCIVEWEEPASFQNAPFTVRQYIEKRLEYDPNRLGYQKEAKGIYMIRIDSYGEVTECEIVRSCGIQDWDDQVTGIIRGMPRWMPAVNHYGKGGYRESCMTIPVSFKR